MYFLDGDRIYIKPEQACHSISDQYSSCFDQLKGLNSTKRIFKLNFFVDVDSGEAYASLKQEIQKKVKEVFPEELILNFIAQPPLTCKVIVEAFYYDSVLWESRIIKVDGGEAVYFKNDHAEVLIGHAQSSKFDGCFYNSEKAFLGLTNLLDQSGLPLDSIIRKWNYIENILGFDKEKQRYQIFNDVRSGVYGDVFKAKGYPAATGIGMNKGGVILEFVAIRSNEMTSCAVDNPEQIAAHHYSHKVLVGKDEVCKTTPKFERARFLELDGKKQIFISGTASILGEVTVGIDDAVTQTEVTIKNIQKLYSQDVLQNISSTPMTPKYGHARVYVKNKEEFHQIKTVFKEQYNDLPVVYIVADICRENLLVEIEGKVILE